MDLILEQYAQCLVMQSISDKLSVVGFFDLPDNPFFLKLFSEVLWYFIEGFHCRFDEYPIVTNQGFKKYIVSMSDREQYSIEALKVAGGGWKWIIKLYR